MKLIPVFAVEPSPDRFLPEHRAHGEVLPHVPEELDDAGPAEPLEVVDDPRRIRGGAEVEEGLELSPDALGVFPRHLPAEEDALVRLSRRVADDSGAPADERDRRVSGALGVHEPHDGDERAHMQRGGRRIEPDVDRLGPAREGRLRALGRVGEHPPPAVLVDEGPVRHRERVIGGSEGAGPQYTGSPPRR